MATFAAWLAWCRDLSQKDKASLLIGMGLVHGRGELRRLAATGDIATALHKALSDESPDALSWRPPWDIRDDWPDAPDFKQWLEASRTALNEYAHRPTGRAVIRLRVQSWFPSTDGLAGAISLLHDAAWAVAVHIELPGAAHVAARGLREVSAFAGDALAALDRARDDRSSDFSVHEVSREHANADVLVHLGPLRALIGEALARPYKVKATVLVFAQPLATVAESWFWDTELGWAIRTFEASAAIVMPSVVPPDEAADSVVYLMKELGSGQPFDVAARTAFGPDCMLFASSGMFRLAESAPAARGFKSLESVSRGGELFTMAAAPESEPPAAPQANRFLQQESFRLDGPGGAATKAYGGFRVGVLCAVDVRIGPDEEGWDSLPSAFPDLPLEDGYVNLTVWLTEPHRIPSPLRGSLRLPAVGPSNIHRFEFMPKQAGRFDGRITVVHRGRVVQTGRLVADVFEKEPSGEALPQLKELAQVRLSMDGLASRREFDLAIVTNHDEAGVSRATAVTSELAWIANVDAAFELVRKINNTLSPALMAGDEYEGGIDAEPGRRLLVSLAYRGHELRMKLVGNQLGSPGDRSALAEKEYIQVVSTRDDRMVPLEFIYDYATPADAAAPCPSWKTALQSGQCPATCDLPGQRHSAAKHVCPMGFWGMRKVIERHHFSPGTSQQAEVQLRFEPSAERQSIRLSGPVVVACSDRVKEEPRALVTAALAAHGVPMLPVKSWNEWKATVSEKGPPLILSMPHVVLIDDDSGLEIDGDRLKMVHLDTDHVRGAPDGVAPLVALLGCDTSDTLEKYTSYVPYFRDRGAAVVIGTVATVLGSQAAAGAAALTRTLLLARTDGKRLGEVIRQVKRDALLNGEIFPLAIVGFGDADWILTN